MDNGEYFRQLGMDYKSFFDQIVLSQVLAVSYLEVFLGVPRYP